jgi:hypothetical protein
VARGIETSTVSCNFRFQEEEIPLNTGSCESTRSVLVAVFCLDMSIRILEHLRAVQDGILVVNNQSEVSKLGPFQRITRDLVYIILLVVFIKFHAACQQFCSLLYNLGNPINVLYAHNCSRMGFEIGSDNPVVE